jgi:hypothetical protein
MRTTAAAHVESGMRYQVSSSPILSTNWAFSLLCTLIRTLKARARGPHRYGLGSRQLASAWGTVLLALAIGATIPVAVRGVVWAFFRSVALVMALRLGQSLPVLFLVLVIMSSTSGALVEVTSAAPAPLAAITVGIVALGFAIWTVEVRPLEARPHWFRWYGLLLTACLMAIGILSLPR